MDNGGEGKKKETLQENGRPKESTGFPLAVKAAYRDQRVAQRPVLYDYMFLLCISMYVLCAARAGTITHDGSRKRGSG